MAATIIVLILGGCGTSAPQSTSTTVPSAPHQTTYANWPNTLDDFRFHWSAAPGIDLATGPAVLVRAYVESMALARLTAGDPSAVYPGFDRATPENVGDQLSSDPFELKRIRPIPDVGVNPAKQKNVYGYEPNFLLSLEQIDNGYSAIICTGGYATFLSDDQSPAKFRAIETWPPQDGPAKGVYASRVDFTDQNPNTASAPPASSAPQTGPAPAPAGDVFGRWFVTAASQALWGRPGAAVPVATPAQMQQCEANMPDDDAARQAMYTGLHEAPPPSGEAVPGWPAEAG